MTYIFMAVHYPEPGTSDAVYARMSAMAESMAGTPGLLEIGPWLDTDGQRVIGLSRWESREAFDRFAQEEIGPRTREAGITDEPDMRFYEAHNYLTKS